MPENIKQLVEKWLFLKPIEINFSDYGDYYCETRDIFQARLSKMISILIKSGIKEDITYLVSALAGEIGSNSFDHNLGNWPDVMGIFFGYEVKNKKLTVILADRGRGILKTLKRVRPELKDDVIALRVAFKERVSGREPEKRGNGLKFVKENVQNQKMHLYFQSGNAELELNKKMIIKKAKEKISGCFAILSL